MCLENGPGSQVDELHTNLATTMTSNREYLMLTELGCLELVIERGVRETKWQASGVSGSNSGTVNGRSSISRPVVVGPSKEDFDQTFQRLIYRAWPSRRQSEDDASAASGVSNSQSNSLSDHTNNANGLPSDLVAAAEDGMSTGTADSSASGSSPAAIGTGTNTNASFPTAPSSASNLLRSSRGSFRRLVLSGEVIAMSRVIMPTPAPSTTTVSSSQSTLDSSLANSNSHSKLVRGSETWVEKPIGTFQLIKMPTTVLPR